MMAPLLLMCCDDVAYPCGSHGFCCDGCCYLSKAVAADGVSWPLMAIIQRTGVMQKLVWLYNKGHRQPHSFSPFPAACWLFSLAAAPSPEDSAAASARTSPSLVPQPLFLNCHLDHLHLRCSLFLQALSFCWFCLNGRGPDILES